MNLKLVFFRSRKDCCHGNRFLLALFTEIIFITPVGLRLVAKLVFFQPREKFCHGNRFSLVLFTEIIFITPVGLRLVAQPGGLTLGFALHLVYIQ